MSFLLDTNICSEFVRRPSALTHRFNQHSGRLYISTTILAELSAWGYGARNSNYVSGAIRDLLRNDVRVVMFDEECADRYGQLHAFLKPAGIKLGTADLMIAAAALVNDFTLVTHNTADFQNVPKLRLADWLKGKPT